MDFAWLQHDDIFDFGQNRPSTRKKAVDCVAEGDVAGLRCEKKEDGSLLCLMFIHSEFKQLFYTTSLTIPAERSPLTGKCVCKARYVYFFRIL